MSGIKRKIRRNKDKKAMKERKESIQDHISLFSKLEQECLSCTRPYDKKSKEHAQTWRVVVRKEEESVRLYCPECWDTATRLIKQIEEENDN